MDFKIYIVGICLLANIPSGKLLIVPNFGSGRTFTHYAKGNSNQQVLEVIPPHKAYVKFRDFDYLGNENWGDPVYFTDSNRLRWAYYPLDGVELSVDHDAKPFVPTPNYISPRSTIYLTKACPSFGVLNPDYMNKKDGSLKSAELTITAGSLDSKVDPAGMIESILTLETSGNVKLRAKPYNGGPERVVTLQPRAEIYIANQFDGALEGKILNGDDNHSMAFYTMSSTPSLECRTMPLPEGFKENDSSATAEHKSGSQSKPSKKKTPTKPPCDCPPHGHKGYGIGCSDTNYP